ncbi:MAG TPA: hypothetical protein DEV93_08840 [Chloroflexi bacterium]|nr:hypothetical protein [Chloroflexota bacterium]
MGRSSDDQVTTPRRTLRTFGMVLLVVIVFVALGLGIAALFKSVSTTDSLASAINPNEYQMVYLTNGETYFGKLSPHGGDFYYIRHVYTLTARASPRSGTPLQHTLIKLTNEIHGPQDLLVVNKSHIVYMENLRPNGCATILMTRGGPCP